MSMNQNESNALSSLTFYLHLTLDRKTFVAKFLKTFVAKHFLRKQIFVTKTSICYKNKISCCFKIFSFLSNVKVYKGRKPTSNLSLKLYSVTDTKTQNQRQQKTKPGNKTKYVARESPYSTDRKV